MPATIFCLISKNSPNLETLDVIEDRPKAVKVKNRDNNATCWIPKSGIEPRKPNEPTYEDEYVLKAWFRGKLNFAQERTLGIA